MTKEDIYVEFSKENITFYGDTEQEKKLNEMLFDMSLENDSLYEENKELQKINQKYKEVIDKAMNELFNLKDMIYKPETREEIIDIQRKISSIIKDLKVKEVE